MSPSLPPQFTRRGFLGLAATGPAFQEKRPAHPERENPHGRKRPVADIMAGGEQRQGRVDGGGDELGFSQWKTSDLTRSFPGKRESSH